MKATGVRRLVHMSALKAAPDAVAMIIAKGSDVNARNNAGDAPLHIAVRQGLRPQGEGLLLAKADIFASNVRGDSPLSLALTAAGGPIEWLFTSQTMASRDANGDAPLLGFAPVRKEG